MDRLLQAVSAHLADGEEEGGEKAPEAANDRNVETSDNTTDKFEDAIMENHPLEDTIDDKTMNTAEYSAMEEQADEIEDKIEDDTPGKSSDDSAKDDAPMDDAPMEDAPMDDASPTKKEETPLDNGKDTAAPDSPDVSAAPPATSTSPPAKEDGNTGTGTGTHEKAAVPAIKKRKVSKKHRQHKIFQDTISVLIPIDVTADLKISIQKTRTKRIESIYKRFPSLKKEIKKSSDDENDEPMLDDEDEDNKETTKEKDLGKNPVKKKKPLAHVPQPSQYGSVLDYLEAKYVKGVMLGDEEEDGEGVLDDNTEGAGSVYSGGSFLDDDDLQRDVAEQVMASTTMTKLELEEEDADFFVNVGNLEVEDNEYGDQYDPLEDKEQTTKKRKKAASAKPGEPAKKRVKQDDLDKSTKSKASVTSKKNKTSLGSTAASTKEDTEEKKKKAKVAKEAKVVAEKYFKKFGKMVKALTEDELPRRKTKRKVALTCPPNKKPGDDITFTNPHNPGQRLRVKVPKDCHPGGTFKVTVPVKQPSADWDKDETDYNKFPRELQELLDDFARAYDDWCQLQSEIDKTFAIYKEKQLKFDRLVKEFPTSLMTPVDSNYLKKIVRRARQNKHKRFKTAALKQKTDEDTVKEEPKSEAEPESEEEEKEEEPEGRTVNIPTMGKKFPTVKYNSLDFGVDSISSPLNQGTKSTKFTKKEAPPAKKSEPILSPPSKPGLPKGRTVNIPSLGKRFIKKKWKAVDFE